MYKPSVAVWQPSASILFKLSVLTSALVGLGLTTGCTSTPKTAKAQTTNQLGMLDANSLDSLEDLLSATDMRAVEGDRLLILKHGDVWKRMTVGFKMNENKWDPRIDAQRSWFITRQPYLDRLSARASRYLYHTVKEAERRGLPTELALLPVIESSYDPAATSSAAAAGMWQFIPSTGRIYGLRQTSLYDGRRDVVESTRAAYEFLESLYNQFGSWELALAAYNAGPGRVQQAINRNQAAGLPTDYWSLKLPQETMNYVPRFLAVAQIIKSPHNYGVNLPPIANRPHFKQVQVPAGAQLSEIASIVGLSRAEFYQLNPGHRGEIIDPQSTMRVLIPVDSSPNVEAKLKALKPSSNGALWASNASSTLSPSTQPAVSVSTNIRTPQTNATPAKTENTLNTKSQTPPPLVASTTPTNTQKSNTEKVLVETLSTPSANSVSTGKTPTGSDALAAFAASASAPTSAPRIPVAVVKAENVKPIEPPITAEEREKILASVTPEKVERVEPLPTAAETEAVVKELTALAPKGTEVVDPMDGKIKLTAIQTSQSVATQQGEEVKLGFAYPIAVANSTSPTSEEAQRNQDKSYVKTDSEVLVEAPKGKRSTYTVTSGDTLAIIAMKNGVNWRDIAKWNQIDPNATLFAGTTLYLYDAKPQSVEKKEQEKPRSYVVKANDTLSGIANQFNLSTQELAERNDLSTNSNVYVGQKLSLIESTTKQSSSGNTLQDRTVKNKIKTKVYTVKRGEYLKLIADRYAMSNQELAALNPTLKADSALAVGQKIIVPVEEVDFKADQVSKEIKQQTTQIKVQPSYKVENYKVQRGDTLTSIATQSKISLSELANLNDIPSSKGLIVGQTIKIPATNVAPETYTVKSGDSLSMIASKYNLSTTQLADLNGIKVNSGVSVGQKLKLSADSTNKSVTAKNVSKSQSENKDIHIVSSGETLASIARKYSLQLSYLADLNGLSRTANLQIGQKLKIDGDVPSSAKQQINVSAKPRATTKNTESYTVKSGDSLNSLANRFGISTKELADLNGLTVRSGLQRGQSIVVPKSMKEYRIQSGDSLIRLANRYGVDSNQLAEMNDIKPNASLRIGDTIKIPNL